MLGDIAVATQAVVIEGVMIVPRLLPRPVPFRVAGARAIMVMPNAIAPTFVREAMPASTSC